MARLSGYKWASLRWAIRADFQIDLLISYININIITSHENNQKSLFWYSAKINKQRYSSLGV